MQSLNIQAPTAEYLNIFKFFSEIPFLFLSFSHSRAILQLRHLYSPNIEQYSSNYRKMANITVYRGFPATANYVWSPFVTKLEARLRFAGLSYDLEQGSLLKAPRGKIPYMSIATSKDNSEPEFLSDTQLISDQLTENGILPDLNEHLSPAEKTMDQALRALLEDKLYFYNV